MKNTNLYNQAQSAKQTIDALIAEIDKLEGIVVVEPPIAEITTKTVTGIQPTSAISGGSGTGNQRGVCWSNTTSEPTLDHPHTKDPAGSGSFTSTLTGLKPKTLYYVRAYVMQSNKTLYGQWVRFTTADAGVVVPDPDPVVPVPSMQPLHVNGHYLKTADGKPFFYLADTAWLLLYRLTLAEIATYMDRRKLQGFNSLQVMLLSSRNERTDNGIPANRNLDYPFNDRNKWNGWNGDPGQPNEAFWLFVDKVVALALTKGMYLCLLPCWGHAVDPQSPDWANQSNLMFPLNETGSGKALQYGKFLGNRYKNYPNILWMLGGDRKAVRDGIDYRPIWDSMATGILHGRSDYLISFHPQGGHERSSTWFNKASWLSFHSFQSGHGKDRPQFIEEDFALLPVRPTIDAEACYENIISEDGLITAHDVRKAAYRAVFEGAFGHVYGELGTFQCYDGKDPWFGANKIWTDSIESEGAYQMGYLRKLMQEYPNQVADINAIYQGWADDGYQMIGEGNFRKVACRGLNWKLFYIPEIQEKNPGSNFSPMGKSIVVSLWNFGDFHASWFNPRTGTKSYIGKFTNVGNHCFVPPEMGPGKDWVLIIEHISFKHA